MTKSAAPNVLRRPRVDILPQSFYILVMETVHSGRKRKADHQRKFLELRKEIALGIAELDRGESAPLNIADIKARIKRQLNRERKKR